MGKTMETVLLALLEQHNLSIIRGDILLLDERWYITHSGLLRIARKKHCHGIRVHSVKEFCDRSTSSFAFRATVYTSRACKGFVGYGDANPSNVAPLLRGAEMRMAETRAVNRALRKAYGIGLCSIEELGTIDRNESRKRLSQSAVRNGRTNGTGNGPRVRDRLCQLIRRHQLDAELVKAYAVDYCGTSSLKEASRAQVEQFVQHLADWAGRDRDALLCQLNSYPRPERPVEEQNQSKDGAA
jgi:hypothetical protein